MTVETANRLYELRKKHNLSQEELAERLGVSRQAVSKWERSEASPDTDNLIALAKIYGLSLDELIYGEKVEAIEQPEKSTEQKKSESDPELSEDHEEDHEEDPDADEDDEQEEIYSTKNSSLQLWLDIPYAIICTVAYLIFGAYDICGGWGLSWIIFITIPIYYTLVEAICLKKFSEFAYPVLVTFIYLYLGLYHGNWHPGWIIFVTIPVYYPIAEALDKKIRQKRKG